jgi:hypothetical protein
MFTQEIIEVSSTPDRPGDSVRAAIKKINTNFKYLQKYTNTVILSPIIIQYNLDDDPAVVLGAAFQTVNDNFLKLKIFSAPVDLINIGQGEQSDTVRNAFTKINKNFSNLFDLTTNMKIISVPPVPEIIVSFSSVTSDTLTTIGSQEVVDIGAVPNDGTGDPLRTAFSKINNNFANLFATTVVPVTSNTIGNTANQVIFSTEIANFNQMQFNIRSSDNVFDSQNIILTAQINNTNNNVNFSAYGTTFIGNALCRYDMDVDGSNVRILCDPIVSSNLTHTIFSQIMQQS